MIFLTKEELQLQKSMYRLWLDEVSETNDELVAHLKNCIRVAIRECLTEKQRQYLGMYLSGYSQIEISNMEGVNKSTVSRTINRAFNNLFDHVKYATPATLAMEKRVRNKWSRLYHGKELKK